MVDGRKVWRSNGLKVGGLEVDGLEVWRSEGRWSEGREVWRSDGLSARRGAYLFVFLRR